MRDYESSHPWLTFKVDFSKGPHNLWILLGECQSKIEHLAGAPLRPSTAKELHKLYLAKGARASTAIEGNTLSEEEVLAHLNNELELPPSREYLKQEVENIVAACNRIRDEAATGKCALCSAERIKAFNRGVLNGLPLKEGVRPGEVSSFTVGVARYRGAPRQDCEYLLERLCGWLNAGDFAPRGELKIGMAVIKAVLTRISHNPHENQATFCYWVTTRNTATSRCMCFAVSTCLRPSCAPPTSIPVRVRLRYLSPW